MVHNSHTAASRETLCEGGLDSGDSVVWVERTLGGVAVAEAGGAADGVAVCQAEESILTPVVVVVVVVVER